MTYFITDVMLNLHYFGLDHITQKVILFFEFSSFISKLNLLSETRSSESYRCCMSVTLPILWASMERSTVMGRSASVWNTW